MFPRVLINHLLENIASKPRDDILQKKYFVSLRVIEKLFYSELKPYMVTCFKLSRKFMN